MNKEVDLLTIDLENCRIFPVEFYELTEEDLTEKEKSLPNFLTRVFVNFCFIGVFIIGIGMSISEAILKSNNTIIVIVLCVITFLITMKKIQGDKVKYIEKYLKDRNRSIIAEANREAHEGTIRARKSYANFISLHNDIDSLIDESSDLLLAAESDFEKRAFSPFWDKIQVSSGLLSKISLTADGMVKIAGDAYQILEGNENNFPVLRIASDTSKSLQRVNQLCKVLIEKGQTDFEFASIFEQKKMSNLINFEFSQLNDSVLTVNDKLDEIIKYNDEE